MSKFSIFYEEMLNLGSVGQYESAVTKGVNVTHLVKIQKVESIHNENKTQNEILSYPQLFQIFHFLPGNLTRLYGKFSWKHVISIWQKKCLPVSQASA